MTFRKSIGSKLTQKSVAALTERFKSQCNTTITLQGAGHVFKTLNSCEDPLSVLTLVPADTAAIPTLSEYRVSTMTVISSMGSRIDLELAYEHIGIGVTDGSGIRNVRYSDRPPRGEYVSKVSKRRNARTRSVFMNQVTMDVLVLGKRMSIKLFRDGKLQLAGAKRIEQAEEAMNVLLNRLREVRDFERDGCYELRLTSTEENELVNDRHLYSDEEWRDLLFAIRYANVRKSVLLSKPLVQMDYKRKLIETSRETQLATCNIVMINSDFDTHVRIDLERFKLLLRVKYGIFCVPANSKYPAANCKFVSCATCQRGCKEASASQTDREACSRRCKSLRQKDGCVTVSILAFAAGKIIMTGARALAQLQETYELLQKVFANDYRYVCPFTSTNSADDSRGPVEALQAQTG